MSNIAGLVSFADTWFSGCADACVARLTPLLSDATAEIQTDLLGPAVFGVPSVAAGSSDFSRLLVDEAADIMLACNGVSEPTDIGILASLPALYRQQGIDGLQAAAPPTAAGALWDARTGILVLFCGTAGARPLYYRREGHSVVFTTCEKKTFNAVTIGTAIYARAA